MSLRKAWENIQGVFQRHLRTFMMIQILTYIRPWDKVLNYIRLNHTNTRPLFEMVSFLMITAFSFRSAMKCSAV